MFAPIIASISGVEQGHSQAIVAPMPNVTGDYARQNETANHRFSLFSTRVITTDPKAGKQI